MRRKHVLQAVILLLGLGVLFSLITFDLPAFRRQPELLELSVIVREADSGVWSAARQGMDQAAADLGVELRFLTLGEANSVEEQRDLLLREAESGADAVLLAPADPAALADDVRAAASGAAVVTLESDMADSGARGCISVDNDALGQALGQAALNGVPAGGRVLLLDSAPGSTGVSARLEAARRVLEAEGRTVHVCGGTEGESLSDALDIALRSRRPAAVLAFEPSALERAAKTLLSEDQPPLLYGMGATGAIAAYLEQSRITAIAAQNEFAAGYQAVEAAVRAARGQPAAPPGPMEFTMVRQADMYAPDNQKLLFPVTR